MSSKFVDGMNKSFENSSWQGTGIWKKTENGADSLKTTKNSLLDLFATIGAYRTRSDSDVERAFSNAFGENKLLATKMAFHSRNIRGGLGERRVSRVMWKWLARNYPSIMAKNIQLVPEFGRWDDLYEFVGTPLESDALNLIKWQFGKDTSSYRVGKPISLMAKWLKSCNTSSRNSKKLGRLTAKALDLSERQYRVWLSTLRKYLAVTEVDMSRKTWWNINYSAVPSNAMTKYRKAFSKRDGERFVEYLAGVKKGIVKINASTLYPYDIVEKILYRNENNDVLEAQWKALPNYVEGNHNMLVMADTSGSMAGRPLATSVGLAIYFAERNTGPFKNVFMTFSASPEFVTLRGATLSDKIRNASRASWDQNTNIEAAFRKILEVAVRNKLAQSDLPKALIVISDMEFDAATSSYNSFGPRPTPKATYYELMRDLYARSGYNLPNVIFWNVNARNDTFHAEVKDGVQFASGQSASVFKSIVSNSNLDAYTMMLNVLNNPVYDNVRV